MTPKIPHPALHAQHQIRKVHTSRAGYEPVTR